MLQNSLWRESAQAAGNMLLSYLRYQEVHTYPGPHSQHNKKNEIPT